MKKRNKFSVVIPVVSVLTIGSMLPITSYAAETNRHPHSKNNITTSLHPKTGIDTKIHAPKSPDTQVKSGASANPDTQVKPDTSTNPDTQVKPDANANPDTQVKPDTNTSTDAKTGIQGYLFKNGVKTPVYNNPLYKNRAASDNDDAPYPVLSSNPNDPAPQKGTIKTETSAANSILYFAKFQPDFTYGTYAEQTADGHVQLGKYDLDTLERTPDNTVGCILSNGRVISDLEARTMDKDKLQSLIDAQYKPYFDGTTIKRETFYDRQGTAIVPTTGKYVFSQAITSGLTTADAYGGALTFGYKLKITAGGGILPAEAEHEFSTQLTASYNHTITVTKQVTNTQTLSNDTVAASYPLQQYRGAVYQLKSTYTVNPSSALKNAPYPLKLAQDIFDYSDSALYLTVTPGVTG
ncbi:hypothetical protein CSW12_30295 (plasmid) [Bacillus cereus]|uniref:hypothetical protein n=1 Tax=Bacillus TaxID=1386 RepID=UPI000C2D1D8F|nr:hypothetical protein [Bacillus cereus]AUB67143.1 hypothetical protein CSW12_30295 [Bacillus cereus]